MCVCMFVLRLNVTIDTPILPSRWTHQCNSTVINGLMRRLLTQTDLLAESAVTRLTDFSSVTHKQTDSFVYFLPSTRPGATSSGPDESAYTYPTLCIHVSCFCRLPWHVYSRGFCCCCCCCCCNYLFFQVFFEPLSTTAWRKLPLWEKILLVSTVALGSKSGYMYYGILCDQVFYAHSRTL
jgi:hypothetical protein